MRVGCRVFVSRKSMYSSGFQAQLWLAGGEAEQLTAVFDCSPQAAPIVWPSAGVKAAGHLEYLNRQN